MNIIIILFIIIIITLLFYFINNKGISENFDNKDKGKNKNENKTWTKSDEDYAKENPSLTQSQITQVKDISAQVSKNQLMDMITTQSPLLTGPAGPPGIQGPPGTTLVASGRLVNKKASFNSDGKDKNYFNPELIVTRTDGVNPTASLSYMDTPAPFVSYQHWNLDINNNIKNRYDDTCLTMNKSQDKVYMDTCDSTNPGQKWSWDNKSNRLISTSASTNKMLKCIGVSSPENTMTTSLPGCSGKDCANTSPKKFLIVKDCGINNVKDDEIWSFI